MEKMIETLEKIEQIGEEILKEGEEKAEQIMNLARQKVAQLRDHEIEKAKSDIKKLYEKYQKDLEKEINNLIDKKEAMLKFISEQDIDKIDLDEIIRREIIEL